MPSIQRGIVWMSFTFDEKFLDSKSFFDCAEPNVAMVKTLKAAIRPYIYDDQRWRCLQLEVETLKSLEIF